MPEVPTAFDATLSALALSLGANAPRLQAVAHCASTNSALLDACRQGDVQPQVLVAAQQSAGRGRLGRAWLASPGDSLTFSWSGPAPQAPLDGLSLAVGVALAEALDPPTPAAANRLRLKWPNDLWLDGCKLGGILIETVHTAGAPTSLVVGVGLNVRTPQGVDVPTAGLQALDPRWTAPLALAAVLPPLLDLLQHWRGFTPWQAAFNARDALRHQAVRCGALEGVSEGVGPDGHLRLRDANGQLQAVRAGEVSLRPLRPHPLSPDAPEALP